MCGGNCSLWQGTSQRVQVWSEKSNLSSVGCNLQGTATCRLQVHMGKARLKPDHCTYTSRSCGAPNTSKGSCCFLLTGKASVCADAQLTHAYIPLAQSRKEHYKVLITDHQSFRLSLSLSLSSIYEKRLRGRKIDTHPCQKSCSSRSNSCCMTNEIVQLVRPSVAWDIADKLWPDKHAVDCHCRLLLQAGGIRCLTVGPPVAFKMIHHDIVWLFMLPGQNNHVDLRRTIRDILRYSLGCSTLQLFFSRFTTAFSQTTVRYCMPLFPRTLLGGGGEFWRESCNITGPSGWGHEKTTKNHGKIYGTFFEAPKVYPSTKKVQTISFQLVFSWPGWIRKPCGCGWFLASQTSIHIGRWPKPWPFPLRGRSHVLRAQLCGGYATTYAYRRWWNETCICTRYETWEHISSKFLALRIPGSSNGRVNELV